MPRHNSGVTGTSSFGPPPCRRAACPAATVSCRENAGATCGAHVLRPRVGIWSGVRVHCVQHQLRKGRATRYFVALTVGWDPIRGVNRYQPVDARRLSKSDMPASSSSHFDVVLRRSETSPSSSTSHRLVRAPRNYAFWSRGSARLVGVSRSASLITALGKLSRS